MVLIGLFVLAWLVLAEPAAAEPITIALTSAAFAATFAGQAMTFAITMAISSALSFVAQTLLKPSAASPRQPALSAPSRQPIENKVSVRQATAPRPMVYGKTRVGGTIFFMHSAENDSRLLIAMALAGHQCEAIDEVWFNDEAVPLDGAGNVTSGKYVGKALIRKHLGAPDQVADGNFQGVAPGTWTAEHRARGVCYLAIELLYDSAVFPSGLPNITAVLRGKNDIYDPRTDTTGYSSNPALCLANYLCDQTYGRKVDYETGIDEAALIAAANACDETVPLANGSTEPRYSCNGAVLSSQEPQEIIGRLLGAMHGKAPYDGERWRIQAGVWQSPTITLSDDDLRAGPRIQTLSSRRDVFNAVKGTYMGPANNWQAADFPPVVSSTFREQDGGLELYKDIELPFTSSVAMAQRIAKVDLFKARQPIAATMPCKLSVWRVQAGDVIAWNSSRYGWTAKPFEVTKTKFEVYTDEEGNPALGVTLELQETASAIYDWTTSEEGTVDPAPNTTLPDPFTVLPPTSLNVAESIYTTRDGAGVKARADLTWTASEDGFAEMYQPEYRLWPSGDWVKLPRIAGLAVTLNDLKPAIYEFRVATVNVLGVTSSYETTVKEITGLQAPPSAPTGVSIFASGGWGLLRWAQSADLDVRIGGALVVRWAPTSGAGWEGATPILDAVPGADTHAVVPLRTGTYFLKFRDSSGVYSTTAASVNATQSSSGWTLLTSATEDPTFSGTKTDCSVSGGSLILTVGSASGTYAFASTMDLGALHSVRLTADVAMTVVNNTATVDSSDLVDSAENWDETVSGSEAEAYVEFRYTTADPGGSPTWTAWARLEAAEVDAWGIQYRYQQVAYDTDFGTSTSGLAVYVEERA